MTPIFMKALPDMIAIAVMQTLCIIDRHIDCIQSQKVWVSGYKPQWYNQITPIFMKELPDMRTLCSIDHQMDCIHSQQVWVSGFKPQWYNKITPIFMKAIPDMRTLCSIDILIASTVTRYEFQDIKRTGNIKWRLYLWKQYQIWLSLM